MPNPDVTVVCNTFRPGGIDVLLAGMRDQTFPRDKFEVVLVDHRYERRHQEVMALAKRYGVPLIHVPEHRRNGKWAVCSSAFTTGFAVARGRVIIMLVDWTYAPPGWIEQHLKYHGGTPTYVIGPYLYHTVGINRALYERLVKEMPGAVHRPWAAYEQQPKLRLRQPFDLTTQDARADASSIEEDAVLRGEIFDEVSAFEEGPFDPAWLERMPPLPEGDPGARGHLVPGPVAYTNAHLKNESVPREILYALNGVDVWSERGGRMCIDTDLGRRVSAVGVPCFWAPETLAHCVNPRHGVCRVMPFGLVDDRVAGRWNLEDCEAFYERRKREIAAATFVPAPAPYVLRELAEKLEPWRTADVIGTAPLDVPDREFFGRDIFPDSPYAETDVRTPTLVASAWGGPKTVLVVASGPGRAEGLIRTLRSVFEFPGGTPCDEAVVLWSAPEEPTAEERVGWPEGQVTVRLNTGIRRALREVEAIAKEMGFVLWLRDDERLLPGDGPPFPSPATQDLRILRTLGVYLGVSRSDGSGHLEPRLFAAGVKFPDYVRASVFGLGPDHLDGRMVHTRSLSILRERFLGAPGQLRLNVGCGSRTFSGWVNIDHDPECLPDRILELGKDALPYADGSVGALYASHMLDHLDFRAGHQFLTECKRVLKPGAPIRVVVCDLAAFIQAYNEGNLNRFAYFQPNEFRNATTQGLKFGFVACGGMSDRGWYSGHRMLYNAEGLREMLEDVGFLHVTARGENEFSEEFRDVDDCFPDHSVYVEGTT